ncbi:MAG: dihydrofolate reductase [Bacteroidaceae bacterium]|nr:dihydrofolate reductase [Bacteroidaceae bacterium]
MIAIIAAIDKNNALGFKNKLLFYLPDDLKRFKALTTGNTVVMGRKTFESLPKGALPNRRNIVLSRSNILTLPGAEVYASLEEALKHCDDNEQVFIMGGASVYKQAMPIADRLYMTEIDATAKEVDVYFPTIDHELWQVTKRDVRHADDRHPYDFAFVDYEKKA